MIRGKPRPEAVMPRLRRFLGDHHCVAHNASFDRRFFTAEMALAGEAHDRPFLCSMLLSRRVVPDVASHKLGTLVHHFGLECPAGMQAHRALADALMTVALWQRLMAELRCRLSGCAVDAERLAEICRKPKAAMPAYFASLAASVAEGA
jgi:DNA polymerase-3 subunit epsilon